MTYIADTTVKCPVCSWIGKLPIDLWCPNGHDLTPWEPLIVQPSNSQA